MSTIIAVIVAFLVSIAPGDYVCKQYDSHTVTCDTVEPSDSYYVGTVDYRQHRVIVTLTDGDSYTTTLGIVGY